MREKEASILVEKREEFKREGKDGSGEGKIREKRNEEMEKGENE